MTDPRTVVSPKNKWTLFTVLFIGKKKKDGWSLALGQWEGHACLAIRWNGDKNNPKGNPCSRGVPTWFVVPGALESALLGSADIKIPADKRALAKTLLMH
jgi:hypothetical protein